MVDRITRRGIRDDWLLEMNGARLVIPRTQTLTDVLQTAARISGRQITWNVWLRGLHDITLEGK